MGMSYSLPVLTGADRATLVRRTYGLVFVGVLTTIAGAAFGMTQPALMDAVMAHPFIAFFAMMAPLLMVRSAPRVFPRNVLLTLIFTFIEGIWIAPLIFLYGRAYPGVVSQAALLTLATFGALSLFAMFSRRDFSAWGSFFMVGLWVVIATSLISMFFPSTLGSLWIAGGTLLVFSGLLVFDTWRLVRSGQFGPDDYVIAAVQIYLDLLNMFIAILSLLGGGRRR